MSKELREGPVAVVSMEGIVVFNCAMSYPGASIFQSNGEEVFCRHVILTRPVLNSGSKKALGLRSVTPGKEPSDANQRGIQLWKTLRGRIGKDRNVKHALGKKKYKIYGGSVRGGKKKNQHKGRVFGGQPIRMSPERGTR